MSEWWSYRLSDLLMFSPQVYWRLFELQNREWWPAPIVAFLLGLVVLALLLRATLPASRLVWAVVGAAWLCVAWTFFWQGFAAIHLAGGYLAVLFAVQGVLLLWTGALRGRIPLAHAAQAWGGLGLAALALIVWPVLAPLLDRPWWQAEVFALAPDPTAAATLGLLLAARKTVWWLLPLPALWLLFSGATLSTMDQPLAWLAPVVVLLALVLAAVKPVLRS